jgi:2-haloacid dehalogenase
MTFSAVIFDFGNVINQWQPANALASLYAKQELAEEAMKRLNFKQWVGDVLDSGGDIEASLALIKTQDTERHQLLETYLQNIALAHATPVDGTIAIIERLHKNDVRLFGMTNAGVAAFAALEQLYPVMSLMEDVFVSGREKCLKPDAQAFKRLLERNSLSASDCVFIDDAERNVIGASAVGIHSIHFTDAAALDAQLADLGLLPEEPKL